MIHHIMLKAHFFFNLPINNELIRQKQRAIRMSMLTNNRVQCNLSAIRKKSYQRSWIVRFPIWSQTFQHHKSPISILLPWSSSPCIVFIRKYISLIKFYRNELSQLHMITFSIFISKQLVTHSIFPITLILRIKTFIS